MVVEIDDSGWGDLVGGAIIVMRRIGTNERYVGEVPLKSFQSASFKQKTYLPYVLQIVEEGIKALKVSKDEPLHICTGYILSEAMATLKLQSYNVIPSKIKGITQELAEDEYIKSVSRLGIGTPDQVKTMRGYDGFKAWVMRDITRRERYVKTGWRSWSKMREEIT